MTFATDFIVETRKRLGTSVLFILFIHTNKTSNPDGFVIQAVLWYADSLKHKTNLDEHSALITDVRFSPSMPRLATSSFDKTVRVWDVENVSSPFTFYSNSIPFMALFAVYFAPHKDLYLFHEFWFSGR